MAKTTNIYSVTGLKTGTLTLPSTVFDQPASDALLAQAIRVYLSRQRQGTKAVKTRAAVNYSTRKIWRQKGTGRARHGSRKAPIFVGGGVAHGPSGIERYSLKFPQKMRHQALLGALTQKHQAGAINILADLEKFPSKTQAAQKLFNKIYPTSVKTLFVLDTPNLPVIRAVNHLSDITTTQASTLNLYEVLSHQQILFTKNAVDLLVKRSNPTTKPPAKTVKAKVSPKSAPVKKL